MAVLKKKGVRVEDLVGKMLNPIPLADMNG
jgi:hypothetical protein